MADPVASLLSTLGGTKTTSNPGDTAALRGTLAQLQGQDFNALLQQIFQQAGGQIPGLQTAYGNAVGARRSGNSAIQNALSALLSQTTIAGADTVAKAQAQNLQTQAQVGGNIAQATKGTTQQQGTNLGNAAKNLAILQGLAKLMETDMGKKLIGGGLGAVTGTGAQPALGMGPSQEPFTGILPGLESYVAPTAAAPEPLAGDILANFFAGNQSQGMDDSFIGPMDTGDFVGPSTVAPTADDLSNWLANYTAPADTSYDMTDDLYIN